MHVLGLPPAFVLSQDQTLKLKAYRYAILDVRTSAHHHMALLKPYGVSLFVVLSVTKVTRSRQTVKLTLHHRTEALVALIYRRLIHRTEPNRPHISSDISISNSVRDKSEQVRPKLTGAPALQPQNFFLPPSETSRRSRHSVPSCDPPSASLRRR